MHVGSVRPSSKINLNIKNDNGEATRSSSNRFTTTHSPLTFSGAIKHPFSLSLSLSLSFSLSLSLNSLVISFSLSHTHNIFPPTFSFIFFFLACEHTTFSWPHTTQNTQFYSLSLLILQTDKHNVFILSCLYTLEPTCLL